jgi:hypothetical protein
VLTASGGEGSLVVFLDIDGVLNHPGSYGEGAWRRESSKPEVEPEPEPEKLRVPIEPPCMDRLNRLIRTTGAVVVISSSWRLFARFQDLGPALARHGLAGRVVGETPYLARDARWEESQRALGRDPLARIERGDEIARWLSDHPEVTSFVILDDDPDMGELAHRLVRTDPVVGLSDADVDRAIELLVSRTSGGSGGPTRRAQ